MKKILYLIICVSLFLVCCNQVKQDHPDGKGDKTIQKDFVIETSVADSDVIYQLHIDEDKLNDKSRLQFQLHYLYYAGDNSNKQWSYTYVAEIAPLADNTICIDLGNLSETAYFDNTEGNANANIYFHFNDQLIQLSNEKLNICSVLTNNNLFYKENITFDAGEETVLGYYVYCENRDLIHDFNDSYYSNSSCLPDSNYPYEIYVFTITYIELN